MRPKFEQRLKLLPNLNFSLDDKIYFLSIHKFILYLNQELSLKFGHLAYSYNYTSLSGGAIRDALLIGSDKVKDLDLFFSLEDSPYYILDLLCTDLFIGMNTNPLLKTLTELHDIFDIKVTTDSIEFFDNHGDINLSQFIEHPSYKSFMEKVLKKDIQQKLLTLVNEKYNNDFSSPQMAIKKLLISNYLENKFTCNSQYNTKFKSITTDKIENSYGVNINNLIGLIKSSCLVNNKNYEIDFLLTKNASYVNDNFDLHLCQASFPYNPIDFAHYNPDSLDLKSFYNPDFYNQIKSLYQQEFDFISFVENNLDDNDLFFNYLSQYINISKGFVFNVTNKVLTFNSTHPIETLNSLKKHYKNIFKKYPYPLMFISEESLSSPIFDIIKENELDILLW